MVERERGWAAAGRKADSSDAISFTDLVSLVVATIVHRRSVSVVSGTRIPTATIGELAESQSVEEIGGEYRVPVERVRAAPRALALRAYEVQGLATWSYLASESLPGLVDAALCGWSREFDRERETERIGHALKCRDRGADAAGFEARDRCLARAHVCGEVALAQAGRLASGPYLLTDGGLLSGLATRGFRGRTRRGASPNKHQVTA